MTSPLALDLRGSTVAGSWPGPPASAAYGLVLGFLAVEPDRLLPQGHEREQAAPRKLAEGSSMGPAPTGCSGLLFGFLALVLAVYAGSQLMAGPHRGGQGPPGRPAGLAARAGHGGCGCGSGVATAAMVGLALVTGLTTWLGVADHRSLDPRSARCWVARSTWCPVALLFGGLSTLAFGFVPRLTTGVAFGAVAAGLPGAAGGRLAGAPGWLVDLSPFSHVAAVPAKSANLGAMAVMLALALLGDRARPESAGAVRRRDHPTLRR